MPRGKKSSQFLNFVAGLNTESSPLVFPENTAKDIDNVDLRRDGSVKRRRGINFEDGGAYSTTSFSESDLQNYAISTHQWVSVNGDDTLNFLVTQIGGTLYFHNLGGTSEASSPLSTAVIGSIDLDPIKLDDDYTTEILSHDSAKGVLFVVGRSISPAYIMYDKDTNEFTGVKITIKIRDTDGIDEEKSSPIVFGNNITPSGQVDPTDDIDDVASPPSDPFDFSDFTYITPPFSTW